jgi:hypothetical protein
MRLLHPLAISGSGSGSNSNQILPSVGSANSPNAHFTNAFSSRVGGITGYEGAGGSAAALAGNPGYKIVAMKGGLMRRAGGGSTRRSRRCKCKSNKSRKYRSRRYRSRRTMRGGGGGGGLSATAAPFYGGANLPYQQYTGGQPNSPNFSVGSNAPLQNSAMANPPPITVRTGCGGK